MSNCSLSASLALGTDSAKALSCNASTLDYVLNGLNYSYANRLGYQIRSLAGVTSEANAVILDITTRGNAAIGSVGGVNKGTYQSNQTITEYNQFVTYTRVDVNELYKPKETTVLPYTINSTTTPDPVNDVKLELYSNADKAYADSVVSRPNMLQNSHFRQSTPDSTVTPPDLTSRTYASGKQVFLSWFAGAAGVTLTYNSITGVVNSTAGDIYQDVPKTGSLKQYTGALVASWGSSSGAPTEDSSVSFAIVDDNYRVTIAPSNVFSVKLEQGAISSSHDNTKDVLEIDLIEFGAVSGQDCTVAINKAVASGQKIIISKGFNAQYTGTLKVNAFQMRLDGDLEFMTDADGFVIRGKHSTVTGGGRIITNVADYSSSLQQYLADDEHPVTEDNTLEINAIEILSLSHQGKTTHCLAGVGVNATRQLIISSHVKVNRLTGAALATLFECNAAPTAPTIANWVNSNRVEVGFISECAKAMETRSPFYDVNNNLITETSNNVVINEGGYQTGPHTVPPIINLQNNFNSYKGFIWDHTAADFPLVEFSRQAGTGSNNQSRQNKVDLRNGYSNATDSQPLISNGGIVDPFVDNVVSTQNDMGRRQHLVALNASKRTLRSEATSFLGKVENWLAYANRKGYTITFKKNGVTHTKDVNNSFNNVGGSTFTLTNGGDITDVVNDRFELQILWPDSDAVQTSFAGALFNQQMIKALRVDLIQVGGAEVVLYNSTSLFTPFVINERPQAIDNVRGVRFTFGNFVDDFIPNESTADVLIGSFFLTTTNKNDSYFLTKGDDDIYGDHTYGRYFSPIIIDESNGTTKWRLEATGGNPPEWVAV